MTTTLEKEIFNELKKLRERVERIEALLEERLVGVKETLPDEVETIKEYREAKRKGETSLVRLEDLGLADIESAF